jgi:hypothetical protein
VAIEVDPMTTYVGGSRGCVQVMLDDPGLEAAASS